MNTELLRFLRMEQKDWVTPLFGMAIPTKVQSKERARVNTRTGHAYTPEKTRAFETYVRNCGLHHMGVADPVEHPVLIKVVMYEKVPKSYSKALKAAAAHNLIYPEHGDLDNKVKAISDALNGVVYVDDKQITSINAKRVYGHHNVFSISVYRNGLTRFEANSVGKALGLDIFSKARDND